VVGSGGERLKTDQARDVHLMLDFSKVEFQRKGAINESISESLSVSLASLASSVRESSSGVPDLPSAKVLSPRCRLRSIVICLRHASW